MLGDREKLILALTLAIGIILILTNTASAGLIPIVNITDPFSC